MKAEISLGATIRAHRLGWGLSKTHGCRVRMSKHRNGILIELCPINSVPTKKTPSGNHWCWWDDPSILERLRWLNVSSVKRYIAVIVGEDGEIKESLTK